MSRTLHLFGTDWGAMMVPIQVIRWYRMQCYDGTDSCAIVVPIRRYCHILKFNYAIAYYLNEELNKQKSKANKEKVDEVSVSEVEKLDKGYRKLYGIQATIVDELIAKGVDLRTLKL